MWINVLSGNRHLSEYSGNAPNGCMSHIVFCGIPSNPTWTLQETSAIQPSHWLTIRDPVFPALNVGHRHFFFDFGLYSQKRRRTLALFGSGTYRPYDSGISTCLKVCSNITHMDLTANGWRFIFLNPQRLKITKQYWYSGLFFLSQDVFSIWITFLTAAIGTICWYLCAAWCSTVWT